MDKHHDNGGIGNDLHYVDVGGDVVTEVRQEGTDIVKCTMAAYTSGFEIWNTGKSCRYCFCWYG